MRRLVHPHQGLAIISSRPSQICVAISLHNSPTKILQAIAAGCLPDVKVLVEHIRRGAIGQLPERNHALLQRCKDGKADAIFPILEVFITCLQRLDNAEKKISPHSKPAVKNRQAPPWLFGKIIVEQTLVSNVMPAADIRSTLPPLPARAPFPPSIPPQHH